MSLNRRKSIYLCGNANKFGAGTGTEFATKVLFVAQHRQKAISTKRR